MAQPSKRFGKYVLGPRVAQGGMAEIFRARFKVAPDITKQVIIKRILPRYAESERFIQMFAHEAQIAMGLSHGNIAQVFDFGQVDGSWFLAMELVEGQSLSRIIKAAKAQGIPFLQPTLAAMVVADVLKALHYAHTRVDQDGEALGIVHRDVSPQNVLVSYEGQVKLVDFGIARAKSATDKTQAGVIKGKYLYFSPEQILEKPLDGRTDVFAAGSVLYQLLTGRYPFQGEVADVMRDIARGNLKPPSEHNPDIPEALERIVLKAMANSLNDRYQTAAEFEHALSGWLHATAPDLSTDVLAHLVTLLFATELAAEGRPVQPDEDFLAEFNSWKRDLPSDDLVSSETKSERSAATRSKVKSKGRRDSSSSLPDVTQRVPRLVWLVLPVLAVLGATAAIVLSQAEPTFDLKVSSSPDGAGVKIDGVMLSGATPITAKGLSATRPHLVQVVLLGKKPWEMEARGEPGSMTLINADLQAIEPRVLEVVEPPKPLPPTVPRGPEVVMEARYPTGTISVLARVHVLNLEKSHAARADLDPAKTYKFWLEGKVSFGGQVADIWVDDCVYAFVGPKLKAEETFGVLNTRPRTITGASRLYAFIGDTTTKRHSGAFRLHYQARGEPQQLLLVDSNTHQVFPEPEQRLTVSNLQAFARYKITLRAGSAPARTQAGQRPGRVMLNSEAGVISPRADLEDRRPHRVLEVGKSYMFTAAPMFWIFFPDDDVSDNEGEILLDVEPDRSSPKFLPLDVPLFGKVPKKPR